MSNVLHILILMAAMQIPAAASDNSTVLSSRKQNWEFLREQKSLAVQPDHQSALERTLYQLRERRVMERFQAGLFGFHPKIGGMETGSGFAFGTEFRPVLSQNGVFEMRIAAQASLKGYQRYEMEVAAPRLAGGRMFADFKSVFKNSPQEDFFGIGKDSLEANRSNFRYESADYVGALGTEPTDWLRAGVLAGVLNVNTATGTDQRFPSVEQVFDEGAVPGLHQQPDYAYAGVFVSVDYRDEPGNPRSGGKYAVDWTAYNDRGQDEYAFSRFDAEVQQYFPFFNNRRVIAFRGRIALSQTGDTNAVPFFMQPVLGGSEDLRGFREFRFRDRNVLVLNLEYRWEAFSGLDVAIFGDAGKVFSSMEQFNVRGLEKSYGIGFRFNTAQSVFWRIDTAFSNEGPRVFLKFGHVF